MGYDFVLKEFSGLQTGDFFEKSALYRLVEVTIGEGKTNKQTLPSKNLFNLFPVTILSDCDYGLIRSP